MNYALFPSPVYALSRWLDFSNLLFIALLSLHCFSLSPHRRDLQGCWGDSYAGPAQTPLLPLTHYGLLPSAGKPEGTARETHPRIPGSKIRALKFGGWPGAHCSTSDISGGVGGTSCPRGSGWTPSNKIIPQNWAVRQVSRPGLNTDLFRAFC